MKAAVYSGSFNPLHIGHLAILRYLVSCGEFDCVYLVVSPQNPFKGSGLLNNAEQRLEDARAAVARYPELETVEVSDIEFNMPAPQYSLRTLCALKEIQTDTDFSIIIGADNLAAFRRWRSYDEILLDFGVYVYPREGYSLETIREDLLHENPLYKINLIDLPKVNVSSTQIREALEEGKDVSSLLM